MYRTGTVPDYARTMSDEVSSLELVRQRVEESAQSTVDVLQSLNSTVVDIETSCADALSTSEQALQVLTHFVSHVLICLFLIHLFSTIISPRQCHRHHSYHPSPHHSSVLNSKLSYFSNPTLHRHLAPFRTDFTDTRTALRLFSLFQFFSSFQLSFFLPF